MAGAFELGQLTITYNRLYIIIFALIVLAAMMLISAAPPLVCRCAR